MKRFKRLRNGMNIWQASPCRHKGYKIRLTNIFKILVSLKNGFTGRRAGRQIQPAQIKWGKETCKRFTNAGIRLVCEGLIAAVSFDPPVPG